MYFMLQVKKQRFLSTAALEDGNVVPHKAHFAASGADVVPRPQQPPREVSVTARLQGTKVSQGC